MLTQTRCRQLFLAIGTFLILAGPLAEASRADFTLTGTQQLTITGITYASANGYLYNQSRASLVSGGYVENLYAYDTSTVNVTGGNANLVEANGNSSVNFSSGLVAQLGTLGAGAVCNVTGGTIGCVLDNGGAVNLSGGSFSTHGWLAAEAGTTIFYAKNFQLGPGLSLSGDRVLGTGTLSGKWAGGTAWSVSIVENDPGATILEAPEPATLGLVGIGLAGLLLRRKGK